MSEVTKKEASVNRIALEYLITSIFIVPLLTTGIVYGSMWLLKPSLFEWFMSQATFSIAMGIVDFGFGISSLILGVWYGARYVAKRYVIKNIDNILKRAIVWYIVLGVLVMIVEVGSFLFPDPEAPITIVNIVWDAMTYIVYGAVIYYWGKKILHKYTDN